jgi:hypothetical protein
MYMLQKNMSCAVSIRTAALNSSDILLIKIDLTLMLLMVTTGIPFCCQPIDSGACVAVHQSPVTRRCHRIVF